MEYQFPPEVEERVKGHMASGRNASKGEILVEEFRALDDMRTRQDQLRDEIRDRVAKAGEGHSCRLDRDAFKDEARRRFSKQS